MTLSLYLSLAAAKKEDSPHGKKKKRKKEEQGENGRDGNSGADKAYSVTTHTYTHTLVA